MPTNSLSLNTAEAKATKAVSLITTISKAKPEVTVSLDMSAYFNLLSRYYGEISGPNPRALVVEKQSELRGHLSSLVKRDKAGEIWIEIASAFDKNELVDAKIKPFLHLENPSIVAAVMDPGIVEIMKNGMDALLEKHLNHIKSSEEKTEVNNIPSILEITFQATLNQAEQLVLTITHNSGAFPENCLEKYNTLSDSHQFLTMVKPGEKTEEQMKAHQEKLVLGFGGAGKGLMEIVAHVCHKTNFRPGKQVLNTIYEGDEATSMVLSNTGPTNAATIQLTGPLEPLKPAATFWEKASNLEDAQEDKPIAVTNNSTLDIDSDSDSVEELLEVISLTSNGLSLETQPDDSPSIIIQDDPESPVNIIMSSPSEDKPLNNQTPEAVVMHAVKVAPKKAARPSMLGFFASSPVGNDNSNSIKTTNLPTP
ncbi:MAG: hypothetical protein H0U75_10345 [Legionella sp.]|nr:hypothetical protein [Legionella sp.]